MPLLRHAKKKLGQDKKRAAQNRKLKNTFKDLVKDFKVSKKADELGKVFSAIDKAAKNHIIPFNRAARMKSSLSKLLIAPAAAVATAPAKSSAAKKKVAAKKKK